MRHTLEKVGQLNQGVTLIYKREKRRKKKQNTRDGALVLCTRFHYEINIAFIVGERIVQYCIVKKIIELDYR